MVNFYMRLGTFLGGASEAPPHGSLNIFEPMAVRVNCEKQGHRKINCWSEGGGAFKGPPSNANSGGGSRGGFRGRGRGNNGGNGRGGGRGGASGVNAVGGTTPNGAASQD